MNSNKTSVFQCQRASVPALTKILFLTLALLHSCTLALLHSAEGKVGEFTIKGETKAILDSDKPTLSMPVDENKSLEESMQTERELFSKNPPQLNELKAVGPEVQRSSYVILPKFFEIVEGEVLHTFEPRADLEQIYEESNLKEAANKAKWEFKVADANGRIFLSAAGKGLPPDKVPLPLKNPQGEVVHAGNPYTGVLSYWDIRGGLHTAVSKPFMLSGLVRKTAQGYIIELAQERLFTKKDSSSIEKPGDNLLQETANWLKFNKAHHGPLHITAYAKNATLAGSQAEQVANALAKLLIRQKTSLKTTGEMAKVGVDERIEITVFSSATKKP